MQSDFITHGPLYQNTIKTMEAASRVIKIQPNALERLKYPRRTVAISIPVRMDDGRIETFAGYRVQHNQVLGPFKGGLRYHPGVDISEVGALAALMTLKNSLLNLPLGGAKGGVTVDPMQLSKRELERLTRQFTRELIPFIGAEKDIPAPDVGTDSQIMAWMLDTYSTESGFAQTGVVTGKPVEIGGSLGRDSATGLGVVYTIEKILEKTGKKMADTTISVQGFGKVGLHVAREASLLGAKILSVSDVSGAIFNGDGLDVPAVMDWVRENRVLKGYPKAEFMTNDDMLEVDADVFAPCALDGVIHTKNHSLIKAKIIVEGANGPLTDEAHRALSERGVLIAPDILANGGGVVVSYFEWVQDIVWLFWSEEEVRSKLRTVMYRAFDKVWATSQEKKIDMRLASYAESLRRLERAMDLRGMI